MEVQRKVRDAIHAHVRKGLDTPPLADPVGVHKPQGPDTPMDSGSTPPQPH